MNEKPEKVPKSALALYVKLYCKRKGETDTKYYNNLVEATKSWLSLGKEEKEQFTKKLEECKVRFKHRFANYLKNVEPYLKKKPNKRLSEQVQFQEPDASNRLFEHIVSNNEVDTNDEITHAFVNESENIMVSETDNSCWITSFMETEAPVHQEIISEEVTANAPLPEPIPPSVKSAKELFNLVNKMNDKNERTWETLTTKEKQRYRKAVLILKKDYIKKYKAYLESLPSKQLFDYYNRTV